METMDGGVKAKGGDVRETEGGKTGSGAQLRREWPLEVGHSSTDVMQSDV